MLARSIDAPEIRLEHELVAAARSGDEEAFRSLTEPYVHELRLHCYRMLGSLHDAEDVLQEALLRAWRHLSGFEEHGTFRAWLYRIATTRCLTASAHARRAPQLARALAGSQPPSNVCEVETVPLQPFPDTLLDQVEAKTGDPAGCFDLRESVQLAFLAAIQLLPPRQRAVLILRDVLGWPANEVAHLLGSSVASVNSALQRARATLDQQRARGLLHLDRHAPASDVERALLEKFVRAWNAVDIDGLVALLKDDALLTMPPFPLAYRGRTAIAGFFATVPAGGALDRIRLVPTSANRQPAVAAYVQDPDDGHYEAYGLMVLTLDGGAIAEITGFADPTLFPAFGLPNRLDE
jgi:RNA polymerase sigma-70 factor (ECF subfamily)